MSNLKETIRQLKYEYETEEHNGHIDRDFLDRDFSLRVFKNLYE